MKKSAPVNRFPADTLHDFTRDVKKARDELKIVLIEAAAGNEREVKVRLNRALSDLINPALRYQLA
jgi:hypothetical protein